MSSKLSLTWDDHYKMFFEVFGKLLETSSLVDCTIAAEGQYLKAHKIILCACSPYFELLFNQENEKNPIVVLKDIKFQELKAMIDFIYRGEVKVPEEHLGDFVDAAESLQIKGLRSVNRQKKSPQITGNEDPYAQRSGPKSPQPCKRLRPTNFIDGTYTDDAPPMNIVNFQSENFEGLSCDIHVEAPSLCQGETRHSASGATNSLTPLSSGICSEMKNLETTESVSFVETPLPPCEEEHPNPDIVVVKSELEDIAEVYIPETDCYIEPKEEVIVEDVELEGTEVETSREFGTNQFSGILAMALTSSTRHQTNFEPQVLETCSLGRAISKPHAGTSCPPLPASMEGTAPSPRRQRRAAGRTRGDQADAALVPCEGGPPYPSCPELLPSASSPPPPGFAVTATHACILCGKPFPTACKLARHCRLTHTAGRPFVCNQCGKAFKTNDYFKLHLRLHPGQRPFSCEVCGKTYARTCDLMVHRRMHTGERPYSCEVCGKSFTKSGVLKQHRRIHTVERPFRCGVCGKAFTHSRNLNEHSRIHARDLNDESLI